MSRVFIVQKQMKWDRDLGDYVPRYDFKPAAVFGEFNYLLSPTATPRNAESILTELRERLVDFQPDDYLLLVGNPCLIGWAAAIAADRTDGQLQFLQWDGREQAYAVIDTGRGISLFDGQPVES